MTTGSYSNTRQARAAAPANDADNRTGRPFHDFVWTPANAAEAQAIIGRYPPGRQASAIMPLFWLAQRQMGEQTGHAWLPGPVIEYVAKQLDMPKIRALEVASFYTMYNLEPVGRFHIQVCGTTPCWLRGSDEVFRACEARGLKRGEMTADGLFTLSEVECLGACVNAPMLQVNADHYYEDLDYDRTLTLLDTLASGGEPKPGPQIDRVNSAPMGGPTTLKESENRENRHRIMIGELHNAGVMAQLQALNERLDRLQTDMTTVKRRLDLVSMHDAR